MHLGVEEHIFVVCPALEDICSRYSRLFGDSHKLMRLTVWDPNEKIIASCLLQILDRLLLDDELLTGTFHCVPSALLAAWTEHIRPSLATHQPCRLRCQSSISPNPRPSLGGTFIQHV